MILLFLFLRQSKQKSSFLIFLKIVLAILGNVWKNTDLQWNRSNLPNSTTPLYRAIIVKILTSVLAAFLNVYFVTK